MRFLVTRAIMLFLASSSYHAYLVVVSRAFYPLAQNLIQITVSSETVIINEATGA